MLGKPTDGNPWACSFNVVEEVGLDRGRSEHGRMDLRFYRDPETDLPHIYEHGVTEDEVREVFRWRGEEIKAAGNSRMRLGQTDAGRYLQVIYVPDDEPGGVFVISAYELKGKAKKAYRRRQRRRGL